MAEQSFLMKLGVRFGVLGSAVALGLAAPIANADYSTTAGTAANRTGAYFDQTAAAEKIGYVVGGQTGPLYTRSGTAVNAKYNGVFGIPSGVNPIINGAVLTQRYINFDTTNVVRWGLYANNNAEPGANAGSGFVLQAYSDTGVAGDSVMTFARAAVNAMQFTRPIIFTTGTFTLSSNVATARQFNLDTTATGVRWQELCSSVAESGANAGSNYILSSFNDVGAAITNVIQITRAALGTWLLQRPLTQTVGTLTTAIVPLSVASTWNNGASTFVGMNITMTETASAAGSLFLDMQVGGVSRFNMTGSSVATGGITTGAYTMAAVGTDLLNIAVYTLGRTTTLTAGIADGFAIVCTPVVNGLFTVTRLNWIELDDVTGTATVTDGTVFWFDANAGTHKCVDAGTTKTSPGTVTAWIKHNINGVIYYSNAYSSKTT